MTDFDKDTWRTPKYFFNWLHNRFRGIANDGSLLRRKLLRCRSLNEMVVFLESTDN